MVKLDKSACLSIVRCLMSNHLIFMGGRHKNTRGDHKLGYYRVLVPNWLTLFELMSDRALLMARQKSL